jgi:hypothetical protein
MTMKNTKNKLPIVLLAGGAVAVLVIFGLLWARQMGPGGGEGKQASLPPPDPGISKATRALWVWDTNVVTTEVARTEFFATCKEHQVNTLFLNMSPYPDNQYNKAYLADLKAFNRKVHDEGMKVNALRAMPMSAKLIYPKGHYVAVTYLRDFLKFNKTLPRQERFDGFILDLDPRTLGGWSENTKDIQRHFVDFVLEMHKTVIEFQQELKLGWAMPPTFDQFDWLNEVYTYIDFVVLLSYSDQVEDILALSEGELAQGVATKTQVVLGLQTVDVAMESGESESTTFFEEGWASMNSAMTRINKRLRKTPVFGGFSIMDYQGLKAMTAGDAPPVVEDAL